MQSRCISNIPRIAVALAVSLMLAFMPFTVNLVKYRITLERNEAHAIAPVFAGALAFLEECAAAAGFASVGEFVATGAGVTAVASGLTIGTAAGIDLGNTASNNLGNLIDAADYPAWDTLTSSEQSNWGSEDNYDAAKYNSLMSAFGLQSDYEAYQLNWGSGQSFEFSASGQDRLDQLGSIGQNWIDGTGNTIASIRSAITDRNAINAWKPPDSMHYEVPDQPAVTLPTLVPTNGNVSYSNTFKVTGTRTNGNSFTSTHNFNSNVYNVCFYSQSYLWTSYISRNTFTMNNTSGSPTYVQSQYGNYYMINTSFYVGNLTSYQTDFNVLFEDPNGNGFGTVSQRDYLFNLVLDGTMQGVKQIQNYPSTEIENNEINTTIVYFPEDGINDNSAWDDFLTPTSHEPEEPVTPDLSGIITLLQHIDNDLHNMNIPGEPDLEPLITSLQHVDSDLHKFTFYQSGELKIHDEGVFTELSDIYALLLEISGKMGNWGDVADAPDIIGDFDFDEIEDKIPNLLDTISELAPFGSVLLLSEMYTILANFAQIEEPVMNFPFDFGGLPGQDTELTIDLSWLDDIKPVINFFCILMLLIAIAHATIRIVELEAAS